MEQQWNNVNRGILKISKENLSQFHFVHHKTYMD
jgi:hypothetical protein